MIILVVISPLAVPMRGETTPNVLRASGRISLYFIIVALIVNLYLKLQDSWNISSSLFFSFSLPLSSVPALFFPLLFSYHYFLLLVCEELRVLRAMAEIIRQL